MITVILTGGTISMVKTPRGLEPMDGVVEDFISQTYKTADDIRIVQHHPYIDSSHVDITFFQRLLLCIYRAIEKDECCGVVVVMGTDTMAHTASAIAMALSNCKVPIVFTGARIPLSVEGSDGGVNLHQSITIAREGGEPYAGIWVLMDQQLFPATRVTKQSNQYDTSGVCFICPHLKNTYPCDIPLNRALRVWRNDTFPSSNTEEPFTLYGLALLETAVLTLLPTVEGHWLQSLEQETAQVPSVIILRCFGGMNAHSMSHPVMRTLVRLREKRDVLIVAMPQGMYGTAKPGVYAAHSGLHTLGAVPAFDHTLEALLGKLHLLSWQYSNNHTPLSLHAFIARGITNNIAGEVTIL